RGPGRMGDLQFIGTRNKLTAISETGRRLSGQNEYGTGYGTNDPSCDIVGFPEVHAQKLRKFSLLQHLRMHLQPCKRFHDIARFLTFVVNLPHEFLYPQMDQTRRPQRPWNPVWRQPAALDR